MMATLKKNEEIESPNVAAEKAISVPSGLQLLREVRPTHITKRVLCAMDGTYNYVIETFKFDGVYNMIRHRNPHQNLRAVKKRISSKNCKHMRDKAVFVEGNILYKENAPGIKEAIDLIIRITTMVKLPFGLDTSVYKKKRMIIGTIHSTKDTLFLYKGMRFVLYGRYIYGYGYPYLRLVTEEESEVPYTYTAEHYEESEENDEGRRIHAERMKNIDQLPPGVEESPVENYLRRKPKVSSDEIVIPTISLRENILYGNSYNYGFCIYEECSNTVLAFSLYR